MNKENFLCLICQKNKAINSHTISRKTLTNHLKLNKKLGHIIYMLKQNEPCELSHENNFFFQRTNIKVASTIPAFCEVCEKKFKLSDNPISFDKLSPIELKQIMYELMLKAYAWKLIKSPLTKTFDYSQKFKNLIKNPNIIESYHISWTVTENKYVALNEINNGIYGVLATSKNSIMFAIHKTPIDLNDSKIKLTLISEFLYYLYKL